MSDVNRKYSTRKDGSVVGGFELDVPVRVLELPHNPKADSLHVSFSGGQASFDREGRSLRPVTGEFQKGKYFFSYVPEDPAPDGVSEDAWALSSDYSYLIKKDSEGDYAAFSLEWPFLSAFDSDMNAALNEIRFVVAACIDLVGEDRGDDLPEPVDLFDVLEHLRSRH